MRYTDQFLKKLTDNERRRYVGREGRILGYRLQVDPKPRPIVQFQQFGRYKEEVNYEMSWADIELVDQNIELIEVIHP